MKAIILAGGKGRRLLPYTTILPKPLMPLGNKPILQIILSQLKKSGFTEVILTVGYLEELIRAYFGDGSRFGLKITYSREEKPLGTAGPLSILRDLTEDVLVMNGDILCNIDFGELRNKHLSQKNDLTVCVYDKRVKISLGVLELDQDGRVSDYIEKPEYKFNASMGIYILKSSFIARIPQDKKYDMPDFVKDLIRMKAKVGTYSFNGDWYDIGRLEDYQVAQDKFSLDEEVPKKVA